MIFVVLLVGVLAVLAVTRGGGEPARISSEGIGPLEIGQATMREMQNWAVGPVTFWFPGDNIPPQPVHFEGKLWQYECLNTDVILDVPCRTLFGLRGDRVVTVLTSNPLYSTPSGTRIGSPLAEARKNEKGGEWSGWNVDCPHIEMRSPRGVKFLARVSRDADIPQGFVNGFYVSVEPRSFGLCSERNG